MDSITRKLVGMEITEQHLNDLGRFEYWLDCRALEKLWVEAGGTVQMANHLWDKFAKFNHGILKLWAYLDLENRRRIIKVINKWLDENP